MAGWAEAAQQDGSLPFLTSWTQHFAFNSMHMCFGAAATQGPADSRWHLSRWQQGSWRPSLCLS